MTEQALVGGAGNGGLVVRVGDTVRRPWRPHTAAQHAWFEHARSRGFTGLPRPLGRDEQGREMLEWIEGDVAVRPYPEWSRSEQFLVSVARLLRELHRASRGFDASAHGWNDELADPAGGGVICHGDLCLPNVVARGGTAVAFLDFDFVAPGRPVWDVVSTARHVVPLRAPIRREPWQDEEAVFSRLRVFVDAYGLDDGGREAFVDVLDERRQVGERFVVSRAHAGEPLFAKWLAPEGEHRMHAEREWIDASSARIARTVVR